MGYREEIIGDCRLILGDCRDTLLALPDKSVDCCVTSPPYFGLRDYGMKRQIGLEPTPDEFVAEMVSVFREVRRVLSDNGTLWLNLGDSYVSTTTGNPTAGSTLQGGRKNQIACAARPNKTGFGLAVKQLIGIPWRVAFALQNDGWYLRQDIIWAKPNPMPESVKDRCTRSHEYIFMLSKSPAYYYDSDAISEKAIYAGLSGQDESGYKDAKAYKGKHSDKQRGHSRHHAGFNDRWDAMTKAEQCGGRRNKRSVWNVATKPFPEAHFATFPPDLIEPCVLAGCPVGGVVLDPFNGAATTGVVSAKNGRKYIGLELNPEYLDISISRLSAATEQPDMFIAAPEPKAVQPSMFEGDAA